MKPLALSFVVLLAACGPAPQPVTPAAPSPTPSASPPAPVAPRYQRDRDPMAASYDGEQNPFARAIIAKLWVVTARLEDGDGTARMRTAQTAADESAESVKAIGEPCAPAARATRDWADTTKQAFERRYLSSVELLGEDNVGTKVIDAQVTVLRDEIESLEQRMKSCPKAYFPGN